MSRYGFLAGSSIPEINSTSQSSAGTISKQAFIRVQQSTGSFRIPAFQTVYPQEIAQNSLPAGTPTDAQVWDVSQNNRKPCKSAEPTVKNLQIYRVFVALPMSDGILRLPLCPFLRFEDSPFYKNLDVIVPPTIMAPSDYNFTPGKRIYERLLDFRITSDQAETITYHSHRLDNNSRDFGVQVLVRFGKLESSILPEVAAASAVGARESVLPPFPDSMPIHLSIFVNVKSAALPPLLPTCRPNMDGRRHARPVNITSLLRISPSVSNHVKLSWSHDYSTFSYNFFAIYLVQKYSIKELCDVLQMHAYRPAPVIQKQIVDKLASNVTAFYGGSSGVAEDSDDDLQIQNSLPVQLLCPLSKCRIKLPVRGQRCQHIQCYDADTYLLINERKPSWKCPVCDSFAFFHELFVDGLLMDILASKESQDVEEIVFNENGSWTTMRFTGGSSRISRRLEVSLPFPVSNGNQTTSSLKRNSVERAHARVPSENAGDVEVTIDLTASDEEDEPTAKRPPPPLSSLPPPSVTQRVSLAPLVDHESLAARLSVSHHHCQQQQQQHYHYRSQERQQHYRPTSGSSYPPMRYAHSSSLTSIPSSTTCHLKDAKSDPRRAYLESLLASYPILTSRPCSHSATSSPCIQQSLPNAAVAAGVQKRTPVQPTASTSVVAATPNSYLPSSASPASHMAIDLATTKELFLKLSALYPHLTSQQIAESLTALKMHERDRYASHSHRLHHHLPPETAHQNGLPLPPPRCSTMIPHPAHANPLQQWRPTAVATTNPSSSYFTSSSLSNIWPSAPPSTAVLTTPLATRHQSFHSTAFSPPRAHSNHPSSPPHQGDPRHPVEGLRCLHHSSI